MYAIIETGGKQYRVGPDALIKVDRINESVGHQLSLKALWSSEGKDQPGNQGGTVTAEIVGHLRGPKVIVFHKRPKKGTKKTQGHRQELTEIQVKEIKL